MTQNMYWFLIHFNQGRTNPGRQVVVATNIYGSPILNLFHVATLASRILRCLLHFFFNLYTPAFNSI